MRGSLSTLSTIFAKAVILRFEWSMADDILPLTPDHLIFSGGLSHSPKFLIAIRIIQITASVIPLQCRWPAPNAGSGQRTL